MSSSSKLSLWIDDGTNYKPKLPRDIDLNTGVLKDQYATGGISFADAVNTTLSGFTATSLVGALNEAKEDITDLRTVTKETTGFEEPENVVVTYDSAARTITLTGTVDAWYRGEHITALTSGWVSDPHPATLDKPYFLMYNPTEGFHWDDLSVASLEFTDTLIAYVYYGTTDKWALRECHGLMQWQSHKELHETIGTYRTSGGTLGDFTLASTTVADRQPSVSESLVYDEDLPTSIPALASSGTYTQFYLSGAGGTANFVTTATDIVPLSTDRPYWNEFTGGAWTQTLLNTGEYMAIWVVQIPTTADTESQKYRTIFAQGQTASSTLADIQGLTPNNYNSGTLEGLTPESVFIAKVIIRYRGGNWQLIEVEALTGTRFSQATSPTGNYLSSVSSDATLTGTGLPSELLGIDLTNANTWTAAQKIDVNSTTAFFVEQDGVKDNVLVVDTTNGRVGVNGTPSTALDVITGAENVRIFGDGTATQGLLHVRATGTNNSYISFTEEGVNDQGALGFAAGSQDFQVLTGGSIGTATAKLTVENDGTISVNTASYETLVTADNDIPNKKYVDDNAGGGAFATASNVTSNSPGTLGTDDFVFGSDQLDDAADTTKDVRFLFDKSKGAFRAGSVVGTQWDDTSRGNYSAAFGLNTIASGASTFVAGENSSATAQYSYAMGNNADATTLYSFAFGRDVASNKFYALSFGRSYNVNKQYALGVGYGESTGDISPNGQVRLEADLDQNGSKKAGIYMTDSSAAPSTTTNTLYSLSGDLYWNGTDLTASGATTLQEAFDGGQSITIADTDNQTLAITNNDTTNNPDTMTITSTATSNSLVIDHNGDSGSSTSTGGAVLIENTGNVGAGLIVYSNQDGTASGRLVNIRANNAAFDQAALHVDYAGVANGVEISSTSTDSSSQALNVVSTNPNDTTLGVNGQELSKGTVKIVHTGTGTDSSASALSIDLQGSGTASQGIFVDATGGGTTGALMKLRNNSVEKFVIDSNGNTAIGQATADTPLDVNGAITFRELSADPSNPDEGATVIWQTDGTGTGDDGDVYAKITAGATTKTIQVIDFSAGTLAAGSSRWQTWTGASRTSDSSITSTTNLAPGTPVRYRATAGTWRYGIVLSVVTNAHSISGAPCTTSDDDEFEYGQPEYCQSVPFSINGEFADATDTTLLENDLLIKGGYKWNLTEAFLVSLKMSTSNDDSAATTQPTLNATLGGSGALTTAKTIPDGVWNETGAEMAVANYNIARDEAIELSITASSGGTPANDSSDLSVILTFVTP